MAKSLTSLNLVSLMMMVNSGATTESICSEYGCTEQELHARLKEICTRPGTMEGVLADIARNEKAAGGAKSAEKPAAPKAAATSTPASTSAGASAMRAGMSSRPSTVKASSPELTSLINKESVLTARIASLESKANELLNAQYSNTKDLREREVTLESVRSAYEEARAEYEKQQSLYDACVEKDKQLNVDIAEAKENQQAAEKELEETRTQIYELSHATIQVLEDGTIQQTSGKTQLVLDDSGCDLLYKELSEKEEYQDLPVKKVKILSRLFKIVEHSSLELEVNCDDPEINRAFHAAV